MNTAKSGPPAGTSVMKIYAAGAVVCALLTAGAYAFGLHPALARHDDQQARQGELNAARHTAANLISTRNQLTAELARVTTSLENLPVQLEPASAVNQRLARLTDLAARESLSIDEMRSGTIIDGGDYQAVPILIAGSGTYPACAKFLHKLRQTFPDTAVRSFETTNNSASPDAPAATFQFDLVWHAAKG